MGIFQEKRRQMGKMGFLYEADVLTWSTTDFRFSYTVRFQLQLLFLSSLYKHVFWQMCDCDELKCWSWVVISVNMWYDYESNQLSSVHVCRSSEY